MTDGSQDVQRAREREREREREKWRGRGERERDWARHQLHAYSECRGELSAGNKYRTS